MMIVQLFFRNYHADVLNSSYSKDLSTFFNELYRSKMPVDYLRDEVIKHRSYNGSLMPLKKDEWNNITFILEDHFEHI